MSKYETAEGLKEVAAFLRGRNGMPLRPAIEVDKRVEYFKGETAGSSYSSSSMIVATRPHFLSKCLRYVYEREVFVASP